MTVVCKNTIKVKRFVPVQTFKKTLDLISIYYRSRYLSKVCKLSCVFTSAFQCTTKLIF